MELAAIGQQYIDYSEKIAQKVEQLRQKLKTERLTCSEKDKLRRKIIMLDDLRLEQRFIGRHLLDYHTT